MQKLKFHNIATVFSLFVLLPALAVLAGWWLQIPALVQIFPGYVGMVFNTGLCFIVAATSLLLPRTRPQLRRRGQTAAGIFIIVYASLVLAQNVFSVNLGIDYPALHAWLGDPNPQPGRMAPNTCLGFILSGMVLILMQHAKARWAAMLTQIITLLILVIGLTGIIGYTLKLELLYSWYQFSRMAVHTASLFVFLSIAFWLSWVRQDWYKSLYTGREDKKIGMVGAAILAVVALTTGLGVFVSLQQQSEYILKQSISEALRTRVAFFQESIAQGILAGETISTRVTLIKHMKLIAAKNEDRESISILRTIMLSFLDLGFDGVALLLADGQEVQRVGRFVEHPDSVFIIDPVKNVQLMRMGDKLILRMRVPIRTDDHTIGIVEADRPMDYLKSALQDYQGLGSSGEMVVCADRFDTMECIPTRLSPDKSQFPKFYHGIPLPMTYALSGKSGIISTKDYRGANVIAAYSPIGDTGLGCVVKIDTVELYLPIREQLQFAIPLVVLLVAMGTVLLHWQVTPLVRRLVKSEASARDANASLTLSELRTRAVIENATDGIVTMDELGIIQSYNSAAAVIFGYESKEVIGRPFSMLLPGVRGRSPAEQEQDQDLIDILSVVGKGMFEIEGMRKDGSYITMEIGINEISLDTQVLLICILRDISPRIHAQQEIKQHSEELARSNAELENFARIASHDLQEPLRKVQAFGDRLRDRYAENLGAEGQDYLARMLNATERMQLLINGLLMFARVSTRAQPFEPLDLNEIVRDVISDLEVRINATQASIDVQDLPRIDAEPVQMRQLFQNLLGNALKFQKPDVIPKIQIRQAGEDESAEMQIGDSETYCTLIVEDNGIGFDEKYIERIFGMFQRLHGRNEYEGSGVGLAICRRIVEHHGGTITAKSQPGRGTRFIVTLPRKQPERLQHGDN